MESEPSPGASQLAVFVATTAAGLNVLFYLASGHYYAGRPDAAALGDVRIAFAALTIVVGAAAIGARIIPRAVGHGLGVLLGLATFAAGIAGASSMPPVMTATLLVVGGLMPVLAWRSLTGSRPAWSFLISLLAVFAAVTLFGAPKIRTLLGIGLWTALIVPGLQIAAVCALAMTRRGYAATR